MMDAHKQLFTIGLLVVLGSMILATQYATTKISFTYGIVHPSNADIRFIGSDNSSGDGRRVLRVSNNVSGSQDAEITLGDWSSNTNKTYTAAFGIVNEEKFSVNITSLRVNPTAGQYSYMQIWLHGDRDQIVENDPSAIYMYNNGTIVHNSSTAAWTLSPGDNNPGTMNSDGATIQTPWDDTAHVRYSASDFNGMSKRADFIWVQISLNLPVNVQETGSITGSIEIHFEAGTHWNSTVQYQAVWAKGPTGAGSDWGRDIAIDSSRNVYVTGYHTSGLNFGGGITVADESGIGMFVVKFNTASVIQWATGPIGAGDDYGRGIAVDSSGNIYVTGYHTSGLDFGGGITVADEGGTGMFVVKYNTVGVVQWATGPTGAGDDQGRDIAVDSYGNVYVTGYHTSGLDFGGGITVADEGGTGMFVVKYNTVGVVQWATGPTGAGNDYGYGTAVDSSGNVYVTGYDISGLTFGGGVTVADEANDGLYLVKYNSAGIVQFAAGPTGTGNEHGQSVAVDSSGNIYIDGYHTLGINFGGGITVPDEGSDGIFLVKYNSVGIAQWATGPIGAGQDQAYGIAVDASSNIYVTGYQDLGLNFGNGVTIADEGGWGAFVVKYNSAGVAKWIGGPIGSGEDCGLGIVVDSSDAIYLTGYHTSGLNFGGGITVADEGVDGVFIAKYS
jgi:nitrogen regulatory protein PII-like uncharacterized protein